MDEYGSTFDETQFSPVTELSRLQRRVLGTLVEKGLTTPEQYPLTVKAATAGCNQKSNREPVTNYSEGDVLQALDELREMGLVAVVLSGGGRTERYRHYVRKRFPYSEPQIAIMTELWLRGRQQLGELRTRASRMVPIESQESLRQELEGLLQLGHLQASGPLERRGIEVDHNFYRANEGKKLEATAEEVRDEPAPAAAHSHSPPPGPAPTLTAAFAAPPASGEVQLLKEQQRQLESELEQLRQEVSELRDSLQSLKRELGV